MINYAIILFAIYAITRATLRLKSREISKGEYIIWTLFWAIVIIATLIPRYIDKIAQYVGVERGSSLAVYLSIVIIFYTLFKILVRLEKNDREITKIVRHLAIDEVKNRDIKKGDS